MLVILGPGKARIYRGLPGVLVPWKAAPSEFGLAGRLLVALPCGKDSSEHLVHSFTAGAYKHVPWQADSLINIVGQVRGSQPCLGWLLRTRFLPLLGLRILAWQCNVSCLAGREIQCAHRATHVWIDAADRCCRTDAKQARLHSRSTWRFAIPKRKVRKRC